MNKYENGKIYTIRCRNDDTLIYVGSSIQPLHQRWSGHKRDSIKYPNMPVYKAINNCWGNWYIELYESFSCNSKDELNKREGEIIRKVSTLNKNISGRTREQYRIECKEKIKDIDKKYRDNNKDVIKERGIKYRDNNKDVIKERKKAYAENNKDKIKEQRKEYREQNKEEINRKKKEYYQRKKLEKQQKLP